MMSIASTTEPFLASPYWANKKKKERSIRIFISKETIGCKEHAKETETKD